MQDNWYFYYLGYEESSDFHYSETAPTSSDITSMFTYTGVPVDHQEWSTWVAPIIGNNDDGSLTGVSGIAESSVYAAHAAYYQAALNRALPIPLTSYDYSTDAHSRPSGSAAPATVTADAYAPQTAWNERSAVLMQLDRSQVPPGLTDLDAHRDDDRHAVGAPAQQAFLRAVDHPGHLMPVSLYPPARPKVSAGSIIRAHPPRSGDVSPCMAVPVQAPPPSNPRHPRARPERVVCDRCKKPMRRQSLKRHVKEVHDHIKRPPPRSNPATGP